MAYKLFVYQYQENNDYLLTTIIEMEINPIHRKDGRFTAGMQFIMDQQLYWIDAGHETQLIKQQPDGVWPTVNF